VLVSFYTDIPDYPAPSWNYSAYSTPVGAPASNFKRVKFTVDLPVKDCDLIATAVSTSDIGAAKPKGPDAGSFS
jgi:hypothetical protein